MAVNGLKVMAKLTQSELAMRRRSTGESKNDKRKHKAAKPKGRAMAQRALLVVRWLGESESTRKQRGESGL